MRKHLLLPVQPHGNHFTLAPRHHPFVHLKTSEKKKKTSKTKTKRRKNESERAWGIRFACCVGASTRRVSASSRGGAGSRSWLNRVYTFSTLARGSGSLVSSPPGSIPSMSVSRPKPRYLFYLLLFIIFFFNFVHVYDCLSPKFRS